MTLPDQYAELKMQIEALEEKLKPLKAELHSMAPTLGEAIENGFRLKGNCFAVTICTQSRATIDAALLMKKHGLTEKQLDRCKKETSFDVIRVKAI